MGSFGKDASNTGRRVKDGQGDIGKMLQSTPVYDEDLEYIKKKYDGFINPHVVGWLGEDKSEYATRIKKSLADSMAFYPEMSKEQVQPMINNMVREHPFVFPEPHRGKIEKSNSEIEKLGIMTFMGLEQQRNKPVNNVGTGRLDKSVGNTGKDTRGVSSKGGELGEAEKGLEKNNTSLVLGDQNVASVKVRTGTSNIQEEQNDKVSEQDKYKSGGIIVKDEGSEDFAYDPADDPNYWERYGVENEMERDYLKNWEVMLARGGLDRRSLAKITGFDTFVPTAKEVDYYREHYDIPFARLKGCFEYLRDTNDVEDYREFKSEFELPEAMTRSTEKQQERYCRAQYEHKRTAETLGRVEIDWYVHDKIIGHANNDMYPLSYVITLDKKNFVKLMDRFPPKSKFYESDKEGYTESAWEKFEGIQKLYILGRYASKLKHTITDKRYNGFDIINMGAILGGMDTRELLQSKTGDALWYGDAELEEVQAYVTVLDTAAELVKREQKGWKNKLFTYAAIDGTRNAISYAALTAMLSAVVETSAAEAIASVMYCLQQDVHNGYLENLNGSFELEKKRRVRNKGFINGLYVFLNNFIKQLLSNSGHSGSLVKDLKNEIVDKGNNKVKNYVDSIFGHNDKRVTPFGSPKEIMLDAADAVDNRKLSSHYNKKRDLKYDESISPLLKKRVEKQKESERTSLNEALSRNGFNNGFIFR